MLNGNMYQEEMGGRVRYNPSVHGVPGACDKHHICTYYIYWTTE